MRPRLPRKWCLASAVRQLLPAILLPMAMLAPVPAALAAPASASGVVLLKNRDYGTALVKGIREARSSIIVATYLFRVTDSVRNFPRSIAEELIRARERGVDVTVILESSGKTADSLNRENRHTAALLSRGGVRVFFDSPRITSHEKVVVIDSRYVYLGSHNLTQGALLHNNELSLFIDSPEMAADISSWLDRL